MIEFSKSQRKIVATALTVLAFAVVVVFVSFVAWVALKALAFVSGAVVPVCVGFFLSLFFKPYYQWWRRTVKNPTLALVLMLTTVLVPLGLLLWHAGALLVAQVMNLLTQGPELYAKVLNWFHATFPNLQLLMNHFGLSLGELGEYYAGYGTAAKAGTGALKCASGVLTTLLSLVFFVFFLTSRPRRGGEIVAKLPFLKESTRNFVAAQIDTFSDILVSFFQRQAVICLIEGCYYGAGFRLVGLPYGFILGFLLGVVNLIPLFGSVLCLPLALPLAYFGADGSSTRLVLVLTVWGIGQLLDGYLITPKIQGDKTGLGYAGVIFSFLFWATVLGPVLGMLLAIPLSAFCVVLARAVFARYFRDTEVF